MSPCSYRGYGAGDVISDEIGGDKAGVSGVCGRAANEASRVPFVVVAAVIAAAHSIHKILLVMFTQDNVCMYINASMAVYIKHYCIDISIWI